MIIVSIFNFSHFVIYTDPTYVTRFIKREQCKYKLSGVMLISICDVCVAAHRYVIIIINHSASRVHGTLRRAPAHLFPRQVLFTPTSIHLHNCTFTM